MAGCHACIVPVAHCPFSLTFADFLNGVEVRLQGGSDAGRRVLCQLEPRAFDHNIAAALGTIGEVSSVRARWGDSIAASYENALAAAKGLSTNENPVRIELRKAIEEIGGTPPERLPVMDDISKVERRHKKLQGPSPLRLRNT